MRKLLPVILFMLACVGCREYQVADDSSLKLSFSCDTLRFDTVFTEQGSATLQLMVYNRNANALLIDRVGLQSGTSFRVNVDGEQEIDKYICVENITIIEETKEEPENEQNDMP